MRTNSRDPGARSGWKRWSVATRGALRQLLYPKEFRIGRPGWSPELVDALERIRTQPATSPRDDTAQSPEREIGSEHDERALSAVATGLWRMRDRMTEAGSDRPLDGMRQLYRHLESTWDALAEVGVEIQSHDGDRFDSGLSLTVLAFEPTEGLTAEVVLETIRPTVYLRGALIQVGEVIVGVPGDASASASGGDTVAAQGDD